MPLLRKLPRPFPRVVIGGLVAVVAAAAFSISGVTVLQEAGASPCGISPAQLAFCETFDAPAGNGNRSGDLNGTLWGASRASGFVNFGQGQNDAWSPTTLSQCNGTTPTVRPDNDIVVCNGQLREAVNDNTGVTALAMYPKQPFDFAGRTGVITFDVSNDSQGIHTTWPEVWITDQPVPTPFTHFGSWVAAPRNGVGLRFAATTLPGQGRAIAAACPNDANNRWSVDSVVVSRNYVLDDQANGTGSTRAQALDCVIAPSGPGSLNHIEVRISQNLIDVYATDAGTTTPLHHIATVPNANLSFSRGLVWLEDAHYNADKFGQHNQAQHTFAWDNVGFDGPVVARDLTFDVPDQLVPVPGTGQLNLGWGQAPNQAVTKTVAGVTNVTDAAAALLTFNFFHYAAPSTITYVVNGHSHSVAWPYPETTGGTWRTLAVPVPLADVVAGTNTVSVAFDQTVAVANMDLVLAGAGGGGAPVPTNTPVPSITATTTATATATSPPSATPVVAQTCTVAGTLNGVTANYSRPSAFCSDQ